MPPITSLSQLQAVVSDGDFDASSTAEFNKAVKAVEAVEAKYGDATITITYKIKKDGDRKISITPKVKATIPVKPVSTNSQFFVDATGRLTDEDPRQLVIKETQRKPAAVKDIDEERRKRDAQTADANTSDPTKKGN